MTTSSNGAGAYNADVHTNDQPEPGGPEDQARQQRVIDCDQAVKHIEAKMAGLRTALDAAKAEAKQARAEAQGRNR